MNACIRCGRERRPYTRGLCGGCYLRARRNGTLEEDALPSSRPSRPGDDPHLHTCPDCVDGGMVMTYAAIDGYPVSWICLARDHVGRRLLEVAQDQAEAS